MKLQGHPYVYLHFHWRLRTAEEKQSPHLVMEIIARISGAKVDW